MIRAAFAAVALSLLATPALAQAPKAAAPAADGKKVWIQCQSCHTLNKGGKDLTGPNLHGLFGRKAGTKAGFAFSPGMKAYGVTWNEKTLDIYLAEPMKQVKGTKMSFVGVKSPAQRAALIAYLKTETAK
jgi:cytochrome c